MSKKVVLLGHGVGIKFTIESLLKNPELDYEVAGVVTHPKEEHEHDLQMMEKRAHIYGDYAYNVFNVTEDYGIALKESPDVNLPEVVNWIKKMEPVYVISIGCRNIVKASFLQEFKNKVLNVHTGPLPRYRGAAGDSWMILNGEWGTREFGCIHYIDTGIDSGDIIAKSYFDIPKPVYPLDLFKIRMNTFKNLLPKAIEALQEKGFKGEKQNIDEATVFPRLYTPIDGKINWSYSGEELIRFIYAFGYPHEGAHCSMEEKKINILEAEFFKDIKLHPFATGLIFGKDYRGNYKVAVKDGYLLLKKIEIKGQPVEQKKVLRLGRRLN